MAPSHSPAALPHLTLPRLGRSVSAFLPPHQFAESRPQPPSPAALASPVVERQLLTSELRALAPPSLPESHAFS